MSVRTTTHATHHSIRSSETIRNAAPFSVPILVHGPQVHHYITHRQGHNHGYKVGDEGRLWGGENPRLSTRGLVWRGDCERQNFFSQNTLCSKKGATKLMAVKPRSHRARRVASTRPHLAYLQVMYAYSSSCQLRHCQLRHCQ